MVVQGDRDWGAGVDGRYFQGRLARTSDGIKAALVGDTRVDRLGLPELCVVVFLYRRQVAGARGLLSVFCVVCHRCECAMELVQADRALSYAGRRRALGVYDGGGDDNRLL